MAFACQTAEAWADSIVNASDPTVALQKLKGAALATTIAAQLLLLQQLAKAVGLFHFPIPDGGPTISLGEAAEAHLIEYQFTLPIGADASQACIMTVFDTPDADDIIGARSAEFVRPIPDDPSKDENRRWHEKNERSDIHRTEILLPERCGRRDRTSPHHPRWSHGRLKRVGA